MFMRSIIFFALLFSAFSLFSQEEKIKTTLQEYFSLLERKEVSPALDHVHPDLINMLGKPTFEAQYDQLFNSPGIEVDLTNFSVDTLSQMYLHDDNKYVLVDYSFQMTFKVDISDDDSGLLPDVLLGSYQSRFGKENVTSDTPGTYMIQVERELFAVQSTSFEGWKIIDFEEGMRIMVVGIIPENVLKHFNR